MNKYLTLSLIAAGLSVSAAGLAADNSAPNPSRDNQAVFRKLDTNDDGKLTAAEMTKLPEVIKQQRLDKLDTNHDGKIEKSEFEAWAEARADRQFARLDTNHDGSISIDEMRPPQGHHRPGPPKSAMAGQSDDSNHPRWQHHGEHHGHHGKPRTDRIFTRMDTNNDGYVSAREWRQAAQQWHHRYGSHPPKPDPNRGNGQND